VDTTARAERAGEIGVIVLAAGESARLGRPKQLIRVGGSTLLRRAARAAIAAGDRVVVVLGAHADRLGRELEGLNVSTVTNDRWPEGMASSIRAGLAALCERSAPSAVIVTLCDQPLVGTEALLRLVDAYREGGPRVVASSYGGGVGVPALFASELFDELSALEGNAGAKAVIARHAGEGRAVPCPEAELDVDTPEDLKRLGDAMG